MPTYHDKDVVIGSRIGSSHFGYEQKVTCRGDFLRLAAYSLSAAFVDVELSSKVGTLSGATHLHVFNVFQAKWTSRGNAKPGSSFAVCYTREITVYLSTEWIRSEYLWALNWEYKPTYENIAQPVCELSHL